MGITKEAQTIRFSMHQYTFDAFREFVRVNMHLVVADETDKQHFFNRLLSDFPPESDGFDRMLERIREGKDIEAASDGSRLDDCRASAGWLLWMLKEEIDKAGQPIKRPTIMLGSTIRVNGRLDANTAFRAEALRCLIIPIIICLAKEFIQQMQNIRVQHTCDNQGP